MRKVHVSTRSLCNTSFTLRQQSSRFLLSHVVWVDSDDLPSWAWREQYWRALGADEDALKDFELANPLWDPPSKTLRVLRSLQNDPEWVTILEKIMLYAFHWLTFSETRMGKVGPCGRRWMLSCSLGLDECFSEALQENTTSRYYANGYVEADLDVRQWLLIAGFACLPVESMVLELLEDDRFFLRADDLKNDMDIETAYVSRCSERFFEEVAKVCGVPLNGYQIKHEVLLSLHISRGYTHAEAFYALTQDPWCLTQGDVEANTNNLLARTVPPKDPVTLQMWTALKCFLSPPVHTRSMILARDQSWRARQFEIEAQSGE